MSVHSSGAMPRVDPLEAAADVPLAEVKRRIQGKRRIGGKAGGVKPRRAAAKKPQKPKPTPRTMPAARGSKKSRKPGKPRMPVARGSNKSRKYLDKFYDAIIEDDTESDDDVDLTVFDSFLSGLFADDGGVDGIIPDDDQAASETSGGDSPLSESWPVNDENGPPLLDIVRHMIRQLSMEQLALLRRNWTVFCCASAKTPLSSGSGCTGSGMDWFVLEVVCEMLMHLVVGQSVA